MSANEWKERGDNAVKKKEFEEAANLFTKALDALDLEPEDVALKTELLSQRSLCRAQLKQYNEALDDARDCIDVNPDSSEGYCRRGEVYELFGFRVKALKSYEDGLERNGGKVDIQDKLKKLENRKEDKRNKENPFLDHDLMDRILRHPDMTLICDDDDVPPLVTEIRKNPEFYDFLKQFDKRIVELAELLIEIEDVEELFVDGVFHRYLHLSKRNKVDPSKWPKFIIVERKKETPILEILESYTTVKECTDKATERSKRCRFMDAVQCYKKAQRLEPESMEHVYNEGLQWSEAFEWPDAIEAYSRVVEMGKSRESNSDVKKRIGESYRNIGKAYYRMADYENAVDFYTLSHELLPDDPDVQYFLKDSIWYRKRTRKRNNFDEELAHKEKDLGKRFFNAKRLLKAVEHFTEAIKREPEKEVRGKCYRKRGTCFYYLKEYDKAIFDANKSIKIDEKYLKGHYVKAESFMEKGDQFEDEETRAEIFKDALQAFKKSQDASLLTTARTLDGLRKLHVKMYPNEEKTYDEFCTDRC